MRDRQGSGLLVRHLAANPQDKELVLQLVMPRLVRLACHEQASLVLTRILEEGVKETMLVEMASRCDKSVPKLARDKFGCRILQQIFEVSPREVQRQLAQELSGEVLACSRHMHANFVLQKCVELLPAAYVDFIVEGLEEHAVEAAQHQYSCRVMQRVIEHCSHRRQLQQLLNNLLQAVPLLVRDAYGHNVIRAVLSYGEVEHKRQIIRCCVQMNILEVARNRQSSLVLEKCLDVATGDLEEERRELLALILWGPGPPLLDILLDRFGNYIAQRVIQVSTGHEEQRLQELLEMARPKLRQSTNGKRILQAARRKFGF